MGVKVSVVVPTYNTGRYLARCLDSLLAQTMPDAEYEVIFVDDGSTDGTGDRLDRAAAERPNISVTHIPNSGWPGRPRNLGTAAARGEYVYYVDHDDSLRPQALTRMYAMGLRNGSDIVIGKILGHGRRVPATLFRESHERATLLSAPIAESMTPHKMFRRAFLQEYGIAFPEGRRRLEDHVMVAEAYLRAQTISVLSDYVCYEHFARDDGANSGFADLDPVSYFAYLEDAIDIVAELTEPGPVRNVLMRRWYRTELLRRVAGRRMATYSWRERAQMYRTVRELALRRFTSPGMWADLGWMHAMRSELLRDGRAHALLTLARLESAMKLQTRILATRWVNDRLEVDAELVVAWPDGKRVQMEPDPSGRAVSVVPVGRLSAQARDLELNFAQARASLQLRSRGGTATANVPLRLDHAADRRGTFRLVGTASIDPVVRRKALGDGTWDVFGRLAEWGGVVVLTGRAALDPATGAGTEEDTQRSRGLSVRRHVTDKGNLSLLVEPAPAGYVPAAPVDPIR